ncbi:hypothetical protein ASPZODRAFT_70677 [Penicilliopsis zonata CBS 506.65]|uniref:Septin-type G domain-containing protein n=1 Tax=Penicilliopsis zonata CBS 506.65 TaxID=1073090 RepID=A0A1L9SCM4_9EURO|nr:hypothetical protein ASPZODRAFT_70677 [Penicilliopsis zonata CBS 506.65]OJJ44868.1 hypothetical protein ASPZODRAFT_70677 [Penicilliopsis zonata CBS 506.65]
MRPPVPDLCPPRSRKSSLEQPVPPWADPRTAAPATFFLTRDQDQGQEQEQEQDYLSSPEGGDVSSQSSMYGVQSLEETVQHAQFDPAAAQCGEFDKDIPGDVDNTDFQREEDKGSEETLRSARRRSTLKPLTVLDSKQNLSSSQQRPPSDLPSSRPLTPLTFNNPDDPLSLPSSPKSLSNQSLKPLDDISLADDLSSQAVGSGEEEDEDAGHTSNAWPDRSSQLIMPSIRMPTRRPFTERGRAMGRFKILLAGAPGTGKTSLIKSIVQACEEIVHVDPFPPPGLDRPRRRAFGPDIKDKPSRGRTTAALSEIYASTKPYPPWWSDLEDSRVLRRRKSIGDAILERNLCFVDTARITTSQHDQTDRVTEYMHQQLGRATTSFQSMDVDFQNLLAGNGGSQVDAILYLIAEDTLTTDIECIQKLSDQTNVIPVIAKADLLPPNRISSLKWSFHKQARRAGVRPFLFGTLPADGPGELDPVSPFAVSSAHSSDEDNMDASVLMSPDYVQPLAPSELGVLVENLFDRDNMAWMRHSAAKKLAHSDKRTTSPRSSPVYIPGSVTELTSPTTPSVYSSFSLSDPFAGGSPSYTMARITDYTYHEEKLARVRLAKWAADLQRSLQNERDRYAALARGERAVWLTERLGECVIEGTLLPITQTGLRSPATSATLLVRSRSPPTGSTNTYTPASPPPPPPPPSLITTTSQLDPLGLVGWLDDLQRRGWQVVQIVGSFGLVGGLALWLARTWGVSPSSRLTEWRFDC